MKNAYDELDRIIQIISKQYFRSLGMDLEDLYQELWVIALEKDFESLALANVALRNAANKMYNKKKSKYSDRADRYTAFEDVDENFVFQNQDITFEYDLSEDILNSIMVRVSGKERTFLVVKCYLSGNMNLFPEYSKIVSALTEEQRTELLTARKGSTQNEYIAKYIFGYANKESGSFKNILRNVRETCKECF